MKKKLKNGCRNSVILMVPKSVNKRPWKIISGGQTGVDRAALIAAITYSIPVGGWVPKGRLAEDGIVPEGFYGMQECEGGYRERTRANVQSSDATLILSDRFPRSGGTAYTVKMAAENGKPYKIVNLDEAGVEGQIKNWMLFLEDEISLDRESIILNVAGPRESVSPGIFEKTKKVLYSVLVQFRNWSGGDISSIDDNGNLIAWVDAEGVGEK